MLNASRFRTSRMLLLVLGMSCCLLVEPSLGQPSRPDRGRDRDGEIQRPESRPARERQGGDRDRDALEPDDQDEREVEGRRIRPSPDRGRWTLGITATDTETGVRVTRVIPRSAADRVGLERGDVIITVNGYQVGRVGGRLYDLPSELERRADRRGRVLLLVSNLRNGELVNLDVRLDPRRGDDMPDTIPDRPDHPDSPARGETISGRALTRPPEMSLPFGARMTVQMFALGGRGQPGQLIGQVVVPHSGTSPIPFALRYDASRVAPGQEVGLTAELSVNGRVLMETRGVQRIGRPGSGPVELLLETPR